VRLARRCGYNAQAHSFTSQMFAKRTNWNLTPNRLSQALELHRAAGKPLLDLTTSNPTECGFSYDEQAILDALRNAESLKYAPVARGLKSARLAVSEYYAGHRATLDADDIFLTTSTSEAYSYLFRLLCDPGDEVLVPSPSYPLFDFLADIQDVKLVRYPLFYDHGWHIDFHSLEQALTPRSRAMIVVHPNNPTGHFTKPSEISKINALCGKHRLAIIADEVFLDFSLQPSPPQTFASNRDALTFTLSGLSKISGLPQMKVGWIATAGPLQQKREALARLELIADTYLSLNGPVQHALPVLLAQRHSFQQQLLTRVRQNLAELDRQLAQQAAHSSRGSAELGPELASETTHSSEHSTEIIRRAGSPLADSFHHPAEPDRPYTELRNCSRLLIEAGWYAILRVSTTRSDEDLAIDLLTRQDVYVHPGHFFDFSSSPHLVLSLIGHSADIGRVLRVR